MYNPQAFREERLDVLHALMKEHPLATLVTSGEHGLQASHLPFTVDTSTGKGILKAHLAKANGQLADLRAGTEALVIFQGPEAYITPSWYAAKQEHGKVVPTWNYVVVHAYGTSRVIEDEGWLRQQIDELTLAHEQGRNVPWEVEDAPAEFIAALLPAIAGIEIPIERLEGKWKMSQNRSEADRRGVRRGLEEENACPHLLSMFKDEK
ncbi:FMN-binding negative transcriptional regulator [Luteolibacter sp. LG18]|uniref:FMN-binding negative transcriptional regulator n=1 Tax=Luteolibacter sp. LG18 TaxID=2819286 RepID=UPI002B29A451|nr:transcriptional regulator [Luteolibacter sp. LG18]